MTVSSLAEYDPVAYGGRFQILPNSFSFHRQYAQIYTARLATAKPVLTMLAERKWTTSSSKGATASHFPTRALTDLIADEMCVIIGTVFKEMRLKPSVLRDIAAAETGNVASDNHIASTDTQFIVRLTSDDDSLFLEDEVQRINLCFTSQSSKLWPQANLVTGVVIAVLGREPESQPGSTTNEDSDKCTPAMRLTQRARYLTRNADAETVTAMARLDQWLASLPIGPGCSTDGTAVNGVAIDLLPGPSDPTSVLMPQQPIHSAALPCAVSRSGGIGSRNLCGRTNPYSCMLGSRHILATSGQGVNELYRYTKLENGCDRMEATLLWGHLAPTCPDTLGGYPMNNNDPLLLKPFFSTASSRNCSPDYPDIYIAGCQPKERPSWRRARLHWNEEIGADNAGALLVSVPRFDSSYSIVLINLKSLECRVVHFDMSSLDEENNC
ncbi:unnamed protein product [Heterobilharzia americana]|nr:unnamed protein product [Heterobilharzia americana]